ncbi:PPC domain-containing DNA-binding protein [Candidatus Neomarinimicrobiota bacterium]
MQFHISDDVFFVFVEKDEEVYSILTQFLIHHNIYNGTVSGIGAVKNCVLGAYNPETKQYNKKVFEDAHELISIDGNITMKDGKPFLHAHVLLSDHEMNAFGGHLFEATVAVVGEFIIRKINGDAQRTLNSKIGLATWNLSE